MNNKQRGFTLIEVLIVVVIVAITISVVVLSVNSVKQNENEIFAAKLENNISASKLFSMRYNKVTRVEIHTKKKLINFYWLDSYTNTWNINTTIASMDFKTLELATTLNNIIIKPNGFISAATITVQSGESSKDIQLK